MAADDSSAIAAWLVRQGLENASQEALLQGFCERLVTAGVPLLRSHVAQRALHPVLGGIGFNWYRDRGAATEEGYDHTPTPRQRWRASPLYHMLLTGLPTLRRDLRRAEAGDEFPLLAELQAAGGTDYFAAMLAFPDASRSPDPDNPPEGMLASWTSDAPDGFSERDIALISELLPVLGLALKAAATRRMARDMLATYLGRDAGDRVLSGDLRRGSLDSIRAVIWYFDLHGFTRLAETTPGEQLIDMLNDYFDAVVNKVEAHGGDVLKFMGDGLLAIFKFADNDAACCAAVRAADELRDALAAINRRRAAAHLPTADFSLALHLGEVMYGNIGAQHRLDFTVVGPAVNMAARLQEMSGRLEQDLIISAALAKAAVRDRARIVSIGRYALRGVREPQELFTLVAPEFAAETRR